MVNQEKNVQRNLCFFLSISKQVLVVSVTYNFGCLYRSTKAWQLSIYLRFSVQWLYENALIFLLTTCWRRRAVTPFFALVLLRCCHFITNRNKYLLVDFAKKCWSSFQSTKQLIRTFKRDSVRNGYSHNPD